MVDLEVKSWWQSKTIWLGVLIFVASVGPTISPLLPARFGALVDSIAGACIVLNRVIAGNPPIAGSPRDPIKEGESK